MIYTVTLNPALDYILRLPRLSSEDVNRADSADSPRNINKNLFHNVLL